MKFCCISDLHGHLPKLDHLDFDCLLIAGDIVPLDSHSPLKSAIWLNTKFKKWLKSINRPIVGVAGNHDFVLEKGKHLIDNDLPWVYLEDSLTIINGLKIYGSPWQPRFFDWAFNLDEIDLERKWSKIPDDTNILLLHGPPYGYGDFSYYEYVHTGSPSLTRRIQEVKPKLVVSGHIHAGYGTYNIKETVVINASHVDEHYEPVNPPIIIDIN